MLNYGLSVASIGLWSEMASTYYDQDMLARYVIVRRGKMYSPIELYQYASYVR